MTHAEKDCQSFIELIQDKMDRAMTDEEKFIVGRAFMAGRISGLESALNAHRKPTTALAVADSIIRTWDDAAAPEGCDA